jgi:hypothetical protein
MSCVDQVTLEGPGRDQRPARIRLPGIYLPGIYLPGITTRDCGSARTHHGGASGG